MRVGRMVPSAAAVVLGLVIVAVTVTGFAVSEHSATQHEHQLLEESGKYAGALAGNLLTSIDAPLESLATAVALEGPGPSTFGAQVQAAETVEPLCKGLCQFVELQKQPAGATVVAATGGLAAGQQVSGALGASLAGASTTLGATAVTRHGAMSSFGYVITPPGRPTTVLYEAVSLPSYVAPAQSGALFSDLEGALYASPHPQAADLVLTNSHHPLHGDTVTVPMSVASSRPNWSLVVTSTVPLSGSLASATPWIVLGLGLLVAVLAAVAVEVLARRHRYAAALVADRTEELNRSLEDLQSAQDALVRNERLAAVGEMASVVGHELRNPLTAVNNALYLVRLDLEVDQSSPAASHLAMAERELQKAATLAQDLTDFVRPREPVPEPFELAQVVDEVLAATPPPPGIEVERDLEACTVVADRGQIAEVVTNLVENAYQAMHDGGRLSLSAHPADGEVVFVVADTGVGVDPEVAARVFEPFFTTKSTGTGLGLAIVRRITDAHHGDIVLEDRPGGGAQVVLRLPLRVVPEVAR